MADDLASLLLGGYQPGNGLSRLLLENWAVQPKTQGGPVLENNHAAPAPAPGSQRPTDWAVRSGVAEAVSPTMGAYGLGSAIGETAAATKAGNLAHALESGLPLAAMAVMPGPKGAANPKWRSLGYSDEPFYRGEASGKLPSSYEGGTWLSRSKEYANGFAQRGGEDVREFRIKPDELFVDHKPVDARGYSRIIEATRAVDPKMADSLADLVAPGTNANWFVEFARRNPDTTVAESGAHVRQVLAARDLDQPVLRGAGYRGIDSGRDVRMLTGDGIRLKDAAFDPAKADSTNITAGLAALLAGPAAMSQRSDDR